MISICLQRRRGEAAARATPEAAVIAALGVALLLSTLLCNEWVLVSLLSDDGTIHPANLFLLRAVDVVKPDGVTRVALLGDSFTFGESADDVEHSFAALFESKLGATYEVLNFGVVGYGIADIRLQLEEQVLGFAPDFVFLMTFSGNDFRDTYLGLDRYDVDEGTLRWNEARLAERIPAGYRDTARKVEAAENAFLSRLHLYRLLVRAMGPNNSFARSVEPSNAPARDFVGSDRFTSFCFWSRAPYPPVAERAVAMSMDELDRVHSLCEAHDATLLVAAILYEEQVTAEALAGIDRDGHAFDVGLPQAHVQRWASERSVPYLDSLPALRRTTRTPQLLYAHGTDMHLNNAGHRVVGEAMADFFLDAVASPANDITRTAPPGSTAILHAKRDSPGPGA